MPLNLNRLRADIEAAEGRRPTGYSDPRGVPTVGVGHNLAVPLSDRAIDVIFADDIATAIALLDRGHPSWRAHTDARRRACVELAFNIGPHVFSFVKFWIAMDVGLNTGDFTTAKAELLDSKWASQVQPSRRDRLAAAIDKGTD